MDKFKPLPLITPMFLANIAYCIEHPEKVTTEKRERMVSDLLGISEVIAAAPEQPASAASLGRERPTVPRDIAYLIEQYGNARADNELHPTAYSALIVGLRGWAASLVDRKAIRNAALEEAIEAANGKNLPDVTEYDLGYRNGRADAAARIRNLKFQPAQLSGNSGGLPSDRIALDPLADYIADTWPMDKKYGLEEICQRLHAIWPGEFMPAQPIDSRAQPVDKQCVLTDEQILAIGTFGQFPLKRLEHGRAIESALLSKLRVTIDSQAEPSDTALIDWLDDNAKRFNFGFHAGLAPVGNVGIQTIGNGKTDFRSAVKAAIRSEQEKS